VNQSETMAAIFKKRSIQKVSHQSLVQFDPVVVEKIKMRKVNGWQMTGHKVMGKAHFILRPWWAKKKKLRHASSWSLNLSFCCVFHVLIRVCLNEDETFKGYVRYAFRLKLVSIHPVVLKIFKDYQFFNQSETMAAIFKKRSIQKVSHQSLVGLCEVLSSLDVHPSLSSVNF
jgi:hypothetical protein